MPGNRVFTDEDLKNMGRRNVDAITEAIDAGDLDRAKDLAQRMHRECLARYDGVKRLRESPPSGQGHPRHPSTWSLRLPAN